ncbi:MAG: hypothetical protein ABIR19_10695 [Ginsengibacter sp.]
MKTYVVVFLTLLLINSCSESDTEKSAAEHQSYQTTKKQLLEKEEKNPVLFLKVRSQAKKNLVGQTVIKGMLTNTASVAAYKDVEVKLYFYSKTKALLESDKETIFEILHPGISRNFKTKYFAPKGTDSVFMEVLGAKKVQVKVQE